MNLHCHWSTSSFLPLYAIVGGTLSETRWYRSTARAAIDVDILLVSLFLYNIKLNILLKKKDILKIFSGEIWIRQKAFCSVSGIFSKHSYDCHRSRSICAGICLSGLLGHTRTIHRQSTPSPSTFDPQIPVCLTSVSASCSCTVHFLGRCALKQFFMHKHGCEMWTAVSSCLQRCLAWSRNAGIWEGHLWAN